MILIAILLISVAVGSAFQIMLDKMLSYKRAAEMHMEWARVQMKTVDVQRELINDFQKELEAAENDMRSMEDCCDICRYSRGMTNIDCPCVCSECAAEACACRECSNGNHFTWRGIQETERRSGNDTGGETQDGGGDRKEPPKTVFTAQAGS